MTSVARKKRSSVSRIRRDEDRAAGEAIASGYSIGKLDLLLDYVFSENRIVTRRSIRKVRDLFSKLEPEMFAPEREVQVRVHMVRAASEARTERGIQGGEILLHHITGDGGEFDLEMDDVFAGVRVISDDECVAIDSDVAAKLKYMKALGKLPALAKLAAQIESGDFQNLERLMADRFEPLIGEISRSLRSVQVLSKSAITDFDLSRDSLAAVLETTTLQKASKGNRVKMGVKWFNDMLCGGPEAGRVYLSLGLSGMWKSGLLLNVALWAQKYNAGIECLDKSKKPAFLYVTAENDIEETIERIFSNKIGTRYDDGEEADIADWVGNVDQLVDTLWDSGFNDEHVQVCFKYRPNRSFSAEDIAGWIEEMAEEGLECRGLIVDYVKRLNACSGETDERLRLGAVVDDLSVLAKRFKMFVFTASQLNRDAMKKLSEMQDGNRANMAKAFNAGGIGESYLMYENADVVIINQPEERLENGRVRKYLTLKRLKMRGRRKGPEFFAHRFEEDNDMRLEEDLLLAESLSVPDLGDDYGEGFAPSERGGREPRPGRGFIPIPPSRERRARERTSEGQRRSEPDAIDIGRERGDDVPF